jgi:hypothetical protein
VGLFLDLVVFFNPSVHSLPTAHCLYCSSFAISLEIKYGEASGFVLCSMFLGSRLL